MWACTSFPAVHNLILWLNRAWKAGLSWDGRSSSPHLLPGCHDPQLDNSILELLLSHNGHKGDARILAVLQLIQELGVLLVQYFCLEGNQNTTLLSALACCSVPHCHTSIPRPVQLLSGEQEVCMDWLTSKAGHCSSWESTRLSALV